MKTLLWATLNMELVCLELQKRCAKLFGMEDSLFVPTGTMGNLICCKYTHVVSY